MRYFRVLTVSLIVHLLLALLISRLPAERLNVKPISYVDLIEKPELAKRPHQSPKDEKQFVRQVELPDDLLSKEKKDAKFASEEERYVLEEQRARVTDLTQNRSSTSQGEVAKKASPKAKAQKIAKDSQKSPKKNTSRNNKLDFSPLSPLDRAEGELSSASAYGDIQVGGVGRRQAEETDEQPQLPSFGGQAHGISSFGEAVPDSIKFGDFTALNTDRHLYYTFYARMEEKIRYRWVTYARAAVYSIPDPRKTTGKDQWVTKLEVILDPQGRFVRAILHEGSGLSVLDAAPVQAFRDAAQFPNPPPEMVKADGTIHIYYAFNVNMGPGQVAGN